MADYDTYEFRRGTRPGRAMLNGSPNEVVDKIVRHAAEVLGVVSRISFQMNAASLPQVKMMRVIHAISERVLPALGC